MSINEAKVEVLKVWYSVFCTLVDAYQGDHNRDHDERWLVQKVVQLRRELAQRIPEVEEYMQKKGKR